MPRIASAVLAAALLSFNPAGASAEEQKLSDGSCKLFGPLVAPGDTVNWTGACIDSYAEGLGTATFTHDGKPYSFTAYLIRGTVPDGHVIQRWGRGWSYDGEQVAGRFQGWGILSTEAGDRFEGQWTDNKLNGFGVLLRANGERYVGDWKEDQPNGNGELRLADGSTVNGLFVEGKLVPRQVSNATQQN
jgi:hypothetical protein